MLMNSVEAVFAAEYLYLGLLLLNDFWLDWLDLIKKADHGI